MFILIALNYVAYPNRVLIVKHLKKKMTPKVCLNDAHTNPTLTTYLFIGKVYSPTLMYV